MSKLTVVRTAHNPNQTREEFLAQRLLGFGGSDIGSLLNEGEYSCKRRLFLERLGLMPEDEKNEERFAFNVERGKFFEGPVAELFAKKAGFTVKPCGTGYIKELPFIRANADRILLKKQDGGLFLFPGPGVLEIKVPHGFTFKKILKEGLPKEYILQLQWQMLCYGTTWGAFAIYWPDGHQLEYFMVERDEGLIQGLIETATREWNWLSVFRRFKEDADPLTEAAHLFQDSAFPAALEPHSKACAKCPSFPLCHGSVTFSAGTIVNSPGMESVARRLLEIKAETKRLEKEEDELKESIKSEFRLVPCDYMTAGPYRVKVSQRSRESILTAVKNVLTEEQKVSYVRHSTYEVVDVKEQGT